MARSGGITGGIRNALGSLLLLALLVFAFGGWWLYNGGNHGGFAGCIEDAKAAGSWLMHKGEETIRQVAHPS